MDFFYGLASLAGWGFKLYSWLIVAAFVMSWIDADPSNSLVRFVYRATMPLWHWIQDKVPDWLAPLAPLLALLLADFGEIFAPGLIRSLGGALTGGLPADQAILNTGIYGLLGAVVVAKSMVFFLMILAILYFVFSLVKPGQNNGFVRSVVWMIDPFISPLQRFLPRASVDLSPIILAGGLYLALHFMNPLAHRLQGSLML